MIDIKILRSHRELVEHAVNVKSAAVDVARLVELDKQHSDHMLKVANLRAEKNKISGALKKGNKDEKLIQNSRQIKEELTVYNESLREKKYEFYTLLKQVPNFSTDDSPIGYSEEENQITKRWGIIPAFTFSPKNHFEIAQERRWIDKERAAKVI